MCQIKERNDAKANFSTISHTLLLKCVCMCGGAVMERGD